MAEYDRVRSVSREEFERATPSKEDLEDPTKFTKSDGEDIAKMERLLDFKYGARAGDAYYLDELNAINADGFSRCTTSCSPGWLMRATRGRSSYIPFSETNLF